MPTLPRDGIEISYTDHGGSGRPVVLVHGWPLSGESWSDTVPALLDAGYRVITYDRRGFGASGSTGANGYDYDLLTADLAALLDALDLDDVTLVGFSMGGGEVARYVGNHGESRLHSVAFLSAVPPWLLLSDENPEGGLDMATARGMQEAMRSDREGFLDEFLTTFFSVDGELVVSEERRQQALRLAAQADLDAAVACIVLWTSRFSDDVARITVPTLVMHGDSDAIVPFEVSGKRVHDVVAGSDLVLIEGAPHGITVSHAEIVNAALLEFLAR
ncbi:alpha/beta fold hydrolase [Pseudactinotalea suaedae]|uniref:alpha/beta fold hydrolase n=1 Tax=Pseudactinotalea suaedae TaxID=1524924 RepID=UPI0012E2883B|nr:alpha/beta hydrolase [Pseudactinotalea suaedae]